MKKIMGLAKMQVLTVTMQWMGKMIKKRNGKAGKKEKTESAPNAPSDHTPSRCRWSAVRNQRIGILIERIKSETGTETARRRERRRRRESASASVSGRGSAKGRERKSANESVRESGRGNANVSESEKGGRESGHGSGSVIGSRETGTAAVGALRREIERGGARVGIAVKAPVLLELIFLENLLAVPLR